MTFNLKRRAGEPKILVVTGFAARSSPSSHNFQLGSIDSCSERRFFLSRTGLHVGTERGPGPIKEEEEEEVVVDEEVVVVVVVMGHRIRQVLGAFFFFQTIAQTQTHPHGPSTAFTPSIILTRTQ